MQGFSCYNNVNRNARAVLSTPASMTDFAFRLRSYETSMTKDSTISPANITRCKELGCNSQKYSRGWCRHHYNYAYHHGCFVPLMRYPHCTVDGCVAPIAGLGFCNAHYKRWRKYGDPQKLIIKKTELARFWSRVRKTDNCWLWIGGISHSGYGVFTTGSKTNGTSKSTPAHRYSYALAKGDIPEGLVLDHLCRIRECVNPDHLEAVTQQVNTLRGDSPIAQHAAKTHCKRGHPFSEENTWRTRKGGRHCRTCARERAKQTRASFLKEEMRLAGRMN